MIATFVFVVIATRAVSAAVYHWPDPRHDLLEDALYVRERTGLGVLVDRCFLRDITTTFAAQWLRIAFHDMSTHNLEDGSGGLDASIVYELERPQNIGPGMLASLNDFTRFTNHFVGVADIIAAGAVTAVAACGGPAVPYRFGRIDATAPGPETVPEPHQDLESHVASFKRLGFNESEMIALVACGHTYGGVRATDFPSIVSSDVTNGFANFDSTLRAFDPAVVTDYISGTTQNPLVVGQNVTTRSDLRIFSSDGNLTMQNLADSASFGSTCQNLLERMINVVPANVALSDVVQPIPFKVNHVHLYPKNNALLLNATLRVINPPADAADTITMHWTQRRGSGCPNAGCSVKSFINSTLTASSYSRQWGLQGDFVTYKFSAAIPLNASVTKFWFEIAPSKGLTPIIIDNGGSGFRIESDVVLWDPERSKTITGGSSPRALVAVQQNVSRHARLSMQVYEFGNESQPYPPLLKTVEMQRDDLINPPSGYTLFGADFFENTSSILVNAKVDGIIHELFLDTTDITFGT